MQWEDLLVTMTKHFVTFYSPGILFAESTSKPIESWDVGEAIIMAESVLERHGAKPYGFRFETHSREDEDLDSHISDKSCMYYLGGIIETIEDIQKRNDPEERILLSNMRNNNWNKIIVNNNSWKYTGVFNEGDVLLDAS